MTSTTSGLDTAPAFYANARARVISYASQDNMIDARRNLQVELSEAQGLLRFVQDVHNSLSPALGLPGELWIEIARIVYDSCHQSWLPTEKGSLLESFLPLTHICHRLRILLRSFTKLWTFVDLQSPTAKMILKLSGENLLTVCCNCTAELDEMHAQWPEDQFEEMNGSYGELPAPPNDTFSTVLSARERIESIRIALNQDNIFGSFLHRLCGVFFPSLHTLTLKIEGGEEIGSLFEPAIRINAPSLRSLRLHGVNVAKGLPSSCFSSLKHLILSSYMEESRLFSSIPQLESILKDCKQLEELCLLNAVQYPSSPSPPTAHVTLNSLRSLTICHVLGMTKLLSNFIICPGLQNFHIRIQPNDSLFSEDDIPWPVVPAFDFLRRCILETKTIIISCVAGELSIGTPQSSWISQNHSFTDVPKLGPKVELSMHSYLDTSIPLPLIFDYLFLSDHATRFCEYLVVDVGDQVTDDSRGTWRTILNSLPNLRSFHLMYRNCVIPLLEELMPRKTGWIPCPKLESLLFYDFLQPYSSDPHWSELTKLRDMVVSRHDADFPLASLQVRTSVATTSSQFKTVLSEIQRAVKKVRVVRSVWTCSCVSDDERRAETLRQE